MRPTLLIVDDHPGFRSLARRLLEAGGFEVVGEAADGHAAIAAARTLRPDVVLLDIQLPDIDGFEVTALLRGPRAATFPHQHEPAQVGYVHPGKVVERGPLSDGEAGPAVVLVSTRDRADYGPRVERCGARGFIPKAELSGPAVRALLGATG